MKKVLIVYVKKNGNTGYKTRYIKVTGLTKAEAQLQIDIAAANDELDGLTRNGIPFTQEQAIKLRDKLNKFIGE